MPPIKALSDFTGPIDFSPDEQPLIYIKIENNSKYLINLNV